MTTLGYGYSDDPGAVLLRRWKNGDHLDFKELTLALTWAAETNDEDQEAIECEIDDRLSQEGGPRG